MWMSNRVVWCIPNTPPAVPDEALKSDTDKLEAMPKRANRMENGWKDATQGVSEGLEQETPTRKYK